MLLLAEPLLEVERVLLRVVAALLAVRVVLPCWCFGWYCRVDWLITLALWLALRLAHTREQGTPKQVAVDVATICPVACMHW